MSSLSGVLPVKRRIAPQLLVLLAVLVFLVALWSYMTLHNSTQVTLDQHVQQIATQLKCPVCSGESVAESQSTLAQEMRGVIRQKIQQGESDQQIIQFFSDSYGSQIVWSPPLSGFGAFAWIIPIALLLGGVGIVVMTLQSWRSAPIAPETSRTGAMTTTADEEMDALSEDEVARFRAQLERELSEDDILFQRDAEPGNTQSEEELA